MAALPYMPFFVGDYLGDTAHLTRSEHGAYFLLIMAYWQRGEPLPADDRKLARLSRSTPEEWIEIKEVLTDFFVEKDGLWTHKRIDEELALARAKVEKASLAGKKSAYSRARSASVQPESNDRSTDVQPPFNKCSTAVDAELNHPEPEPDKELGNINPTPAAAAEVKPLKIDPDRELKQSIENAFTSQLPGNRFTSYPKERENIKRIVALAKSHQPEDPGYFAKSMIERYWHLRQQDKFIGKQPFTPSCLISQWDRVMLATGDNTNENEARRKAMADLGAL